ACSTDCATHINSPLTISQVCHCKACVCSFTASSTWHLKVPAKPKIPLFLQVTPEVGP
ncbi:hypothetical protein NDU88_002832, partial [Pleurodeles waltl]